MSDMNNKTNKNKNIAALAVSILILLLLIIIIGAAYAKYVSSARGTASAKVADIICNMNVTASSDSTLVNPYCTVTLTDYTNENNTEKITEASLNYTVSVSLNQESELDTLPAYYWEDSSGNPVGTPSQPLTGTFTKGIRDTQVYRVYFVNPGTEDITGKIDFDLTAVQKANN